MNRELANAVATCRSEMLASARHEMSFKSRRAMLLCMGPPDARALRDGKRRRLALALACGRRVVHAWKRDIGTDDAEFVLSLVEKVLRGTGSIQDAWEEAYAFRGGLDNDHHGRDVAYLAGRCAAQVGTVAFVDELLVPDTGTSQAVLDNPEDPDLWDAAFFAAGSAAKGMPWMKGFDRDLYRDFWLWYLDRAVPDAFGASTLAP